MPCLSPKIFQVGLDSQNREQGELEQSCRISLQYTQGRLPVKENGCYFGDLCADEVMEKHVGNPDYLTDV